MNLTCDVCDGELKIATGGQKAICTNCGVSYDMDRLREKLGVSSAGQQPPVFNNTVQQPPQVYTEPVAPSNPVNPVPNNYNLPMRALHIKRIVDLHLCKIAVIIDDEEVSVLKGQGKVTSIPISQGQHTIYVRIGSASGIVELEKYSFYVSDYDWIGEVGLYRGAFKASYQFRIGEQK